MTTTTTTNGHTNGTLHIVRWGLGILAAVAASIFAAIFLWMFFTISDSATQIKLINSRLYGIEHRHNNDK